MRYKIFGGQPAASQDRIDLYWAHFADEVPPPEEITADRMAERRALTGPS